MGYMTVSLCMIAYNEEHTLNRLLEQIASQTYPKAETELVLVDSASSDATKSLFEHFAAAHREEYLSIQVLDNPKRSQAAGWNTAIRAAMGEVILRLDAHAEIPEDFLAQNMKLIEEGEDVCGGARPNKIDEPTPKKELLLLAESSMFGSSPAGYRWKSGEKKYVDSVFHGCYRREVFAKVGGFHEDLGRTEDNELHYRIRKAGYRICQGSDIVSYQYVRGTLGGLLQQKYGNGKWIALTLGVCYQCISSFHFVPFFFVFITLCALLLFATAFITGHLWMALPFIVVFGSYVLASFMMTIAAMLSAEKKHVNQLLLPVIFFLLHSAYGWGTLIGLIQLPFWKHGLKKKARETGVSAQDEIENVRQAVIQHTAATPKEEAGS